jgi:catechol 2,3-dioxygenase-like lactoylglutathione lyase family enzyme
MRLHHAAVVCASQENADRFYGKILGLETIKAQTLGRDLSEQIFGIPSKCGMVLYGREGLAVEVFIPPEGAKPARTFQHLCIAVRDREALLDRCIAVGLAVKKVAKGNALVVFVEDFDGNLFEIKEMAS